VANRKTQLSAARKAANQSSPVGTNKRPINYVWSFRFHTKTGSATGTVGAPTMLSALEEVQLFTGMRVDQMRQLEIQRYDWKE
jgi:hypothetical protein